MVRDQSRAARIGPDDRPSLSGRFFWPPNGEALKDIYRGPGDARSGTAIAPGFPVGGEGVDSSWNDWITGPNALLGPVLDAIDPDLSAFKARGGKLLIYHGWADGDIAPLNSVAYFESVRAKMGQRDADASIRLFMAPGVSHCFGGPGPDTFDMLTALEKWDETGVAPQSIVAKKHMFGMLALIGYWPGPLIRSRPLCPYPQTAHWNGQGSTRRASNFFCAR